jgi:DNA-binding GntR family transcriptional regulator
MDTINRLSKLPLHQQLYDILRGKILGRQWSEGEMIPPESELTAHYKVSRIVVRQVLNRLVNEGLIFRQQGRGSFVSKHTLEHALSRILSFTEDMTQRGYRPTTEVLFADLIPAPHEIAERLQIPEGTSLARIDRLRLADGEPMSIEESHLVHELCPGILEEDLHKVSLKSILDQRWGLRFVRANQSIRAVISSRAQAKLLGIPGRSPLLFVERVSYSQTNTPSEFLRIYYRGDRYALYGELRE